MDCKRLVFHRLPLLDWRTQESRKVLESRIMSYCTVKCCGKNSRTSSFKKDGITFHRFPRCPDIKSKWIDATSRGEGWLPSNGSVVCSRHFAKDCFQPMMNCRRLLYNAVPTLYLPILDQQANNSSGKKNMPTPSSRLLRSSLTSSLGTEQSKSNKNQTSDPVTKTTKSRTLDRDNPSAYTSPTEKHLCRRIMDLKNTIQIKNKVIKNERGCNRRLKRKIISLNLMLAQLEKKSN